MDPLLVAAGLVKTFDGHTVVDGLDLSVGPGTAWALTGPNGCGKSTVLRCLSGHEEPDAGEVVAGGDPVASSAYRQHVFPVFDDWTFFPDITVHEHLAFLAGLHGLPDVGQVATDALVRFGTDRVAGQFPDTLSSGQIRRVAFAAASIRPWQVLLLDEPEQRLDVDGRDTLVAFLTENLAAGRGLVFATHDLELVRRVGARTVPLTAA
jgi:ABC-2 type transport system ATP-binding protein